VAQSAKEKTSIALIHFSCDFHSPARPILGMPSPNTAALLAAKSDFQPALLAWYRASARKLPWRDQPSLYKTVVSEFMLQQTQVKTVLPYFARWMAALPDFTALAAAPEARVLKLWEGLGYYSRARNLHRLAQAIAACSTPPETPEAWLALPGVGPYTAAAVTSITFHAPVACVDGNVVRILARLTADDTPFRDSATGSRAFAPLANALLPASAPGDHNQAMMELGATICFRQNPLCTVCPVYACCAGARTGEPEAFPKLAAKQMEQIAVMRVWCVQGGKLLLHRAATGAKRFAGMHELPTPIQIGWTEKKAVAGKLLARKRRGITRFQITESIYGATAPAKLASDDLVWIRLDDLESITLSGPHRRWVSALLAEAATLGQGL